MFWQTFNELVENKDLYRSKGDFEEILHKQFLFSNLKDFIGS
jgi:hypothetical protein